MTVPSSIAVGSHVWVEDPEEAWIAGEVVEVNGEELKVICTSGETVVANSADVHPKDPEDQSCSVDDMTKLAYLHEPSVLQNLRRRYDTNEIYTYTGNILIAVNPFQRLPHLYSDDIKEKYKGKVLGELSPHPFAIADAAYRQMINEGISQSILVSGESGAGKTECTKMLMCYLAYMGAAAEIEGRTVQQKVLESSPVLEAFGNAKTVRNNNSSRFGKFVEIQFNSSGRISGAAIRTYLLERSRVCQVSDPERNYHCFYMLCAAPPEYIEKYKLGNPRMFHYLNQSNCYELDGVDNFKEYLSTRRAMDIVGISSDEQEAIFRVVAAILHLGNIEFAKISDGDASQPKDDQSRFHLKTTAELLMCDEKLLEDSLCKRVMVTRDETITKSLNPEGATVSRDALAKIIYSRLFDWLVNKINNSIGQDPDSQFIIGVLDIYGFESFETNSFEQFCINLTNEKLQQHFNQHVFKMEQEQYKREEIDWSFIEFIDNQDILDLIEKKPGGIISLLDEACMFPRSTHETFAQKLYQTFKEHKRFSKPKLSQTGFSISHYAGDVTYQTEQFLDKNKDYVVAEHQALLRASRCSFVSGLFPPSPEESSKTSKFSSIGSRFKQQLQALLETLNATEPHYIRCVKPNNLLKPAIFENSNVLQQLRCGGVMEAIRISCAGFPTQKLFDEFISRFKILEPNVLDGSFDEVTACSRLLEKSNLKGYQIGKTKVFLRAGQMAELDSCRNRILGRSACVIQRKFRSYFACKYFLSLRVSAIQIQALCRGQVARYIYECKRRTAAALIIQKYVRMFFSRKAYVILCYSAVLLQAGIWGMAARNELRFRKQNKAAITIQSHCLGYSACYWYLRLKGAAISMQCACRASIALKELQELKLAAKEISSLQEAKTKLEKQVEELTLQLQLEKRKRVDNEEAKNHETAKLQSDLEEMQKQFQDAKALQEAKIMLEKQVEELTLQLEMEKRMRTDIEEAKNHEIAKLQSHLEEMQMQMQQMQFQASKETSALSKARTNLGNQVEELIIQLQLEKNMRVDIEEAKNLEIARLQSALEEIKIQFEETKEQLMKKRGAEKEAPVPVPSLEEASIIGNELVDKLTSENENLKFLVSSLEKKIDETENKCEEMNKLCEDRLKQALEAETKIIQLKTEKQRLEEKISDIETMDQVIQQESLINSSAGKISRHLVQDTQAAENGYVHESHGETPTKKFGTESDSMLRRSNIERQRENMDTLIRCINKDLGFSEGKPVAAFTIYKCLIHWKSFEAKRTNIFDRLIQIIGCALEDEADTNRMAYWLSNTSTLLFLLLRTLKDTSSSQSPQPTSFFGRMTQGFRSSPSSTSLNIGGLDGVQQVEAKYPALLFKEQLTAYLETFYGIIRDNSKKELSPLLSSCIQVPRTSIGNSVESSDRCFNNSSPSGHWQSIIDGLNGLLSTLKDNFVPLVIVQKIFTEIFSYINVQLFNSILLQKKCCTFSHGEHVKAGLAELELWCGNAHEYAGSSWDELKYVQQAIRLLVLQQKTEITYEDLTTELCPILSSQQLNRICNLYSDDNSSTESVPPDVISKLKTHLGDSDDADSNSYLLDDNSGIPFSAESISSSLQDSDFKGVKPAVELLQNPDFEFLKG